MTELTDRLTLLAIEKNIPLVATLELTRRCPCRCVHCYLSEIRGGKKTAAGEELGTGEWKAVLRQLAESGCLFLVLTGGEPLLRPDFAELCAFAASLRFDIRVFTTGFGLTGALVKRLKGCNISAFELSLYGRKKVHDSVTGVPGSYDTTLAAAKRLKKAGFRVKLKSPLMRLNAGEERHIMRLCGRCGFGFSFDPVVAPVNDGGRETLKLRLPAEKLERIFSDRRLNGPALESLEAGATYADFFCGAGRSVLSVDPYGKVMPCLQMPVALGDLRGRSLSRLWRDSRWLKKWRGMKLADLKECSACRYEPVCSRCPGISLLEEGDLLAPNEPACGSAKLSYSFARRGRAITSGGGEKRPTG